MSEAKFTEGPWTVEVGHIVARDSDGILRKNLDDAGQASSIAKVFGPDAEANACLIAAAPDLYVALEGLLEGKVRNSHHAVHPSGRFCNVCGLNSEEAVHCADCPVLVAETALAKARGEQ